MKLQPQEMTHDLRNNAARTQARKGREVRRYFGKLGVSKLYTPDAICYDLELIRKWIK